MELVARLLAGVVAAWIPIESEGVKRDATSGNLGSPAVGSAGLRPKQNAVSSMEKKEPPIRREALEAPAQRHRVAGLRGSLRASAQRPPFE